MNNAVVNLGANIEPEANISAALTMLRTRFHVLKESNFQWTEAISPDPQPDYLNGAVFIQTQYTFENFKKALKTIEKTIGRTKKREKYAPRSIDLDILIWNNQIIHADYHNRSFVQEYVHELLDPEELTSLHPST